jgi:hypothetical protein
MNVKPQNNPDLELEFKIPTEEDFIHNKRIYHPLTSEKYLAFVKMGLKMNKYLDKYITLRMKQGPTVRFEL